MDIFIILGTCSMYYDRNIRRFLPRENRCSGIIWQLRLLYSDLARFSSLIIDIITYARLRESIDVG